MNILLVDDSRTVRQVLENIINSYFETKKWEKPNLYTACDGLEALENMQTLDIDMMFLDYNMPNMNGEEALLKIRENKKWNDTRIIMATTEGGKEKVIKLIKAGANGYMVKPFDKEYIFKIMGNIIKRMSKKPVSI